MWIAYGRLLNMWSGRPVRWVRRVAVPWRVGRSLSACVGVGWVGWPGLFGDGQELADLGFGQVARQADAT